MCGKFTNGVSNDSYELEGVVVHTDVVDGESTGAGYIGLVVFEAPCKTADPKLIAR